MPGMKRTNVETLLVACEDFLAENEPEGHVGEQIRWHVSTLMTNLDDLLDKGETFG